MRFELLLIMLCHIIYIIIQWSLIVLPSICLFLYFYYFVMQWERKTNYRL